MLASPKFLGYTKDAHLVKIKNDVKSAELVVGTELIDSDSLWKWGKPVDISLEEIKSKKQLYDVKGLLLEEELEPGEYWKINKSELKTKLKGNFYVNKGGKVYYENINVSDNNIVNSSYEFLGEAPAAELISGDDLANELNITEGVPQYSNEPWLKFTKKNETTGKLTTMYVAKKPLRYSMSWDQMYAKGLVYGDGKPGGDATVVINGQTYKVRLMRGADINLNPRLIIKRNPLINHNSEWNRMMLPIHEQAIDKSWTYKNNVEKDLKPFVHNFGSGNQGRYTDADLLTHSDFGKGTNSSMQEKIERTEQPEPYILGRGIGSVSFSIPGNSNGTGPSRGWRPVLELID